MQKRRHQCGLNIHAGKPCIHHVMWRQRESIVLHKFIFVELPGSIGVHVDYPAKFGICVRIHEVHPCQVRVLVSVPGQEETQEGKEKRWKKSVTWGEIMEEKLNVVDDKNLYWHQLPIFVGWVGGWLRPRGKRCVAMAPEYMHVIRQHAKVGHRPNLL